MNNTIHINSQYMNVRYTYYCFTLREISNIGTLTLYIVIIFEDKLNKLRGQSCNNPLNWNRGCLLLTSYLYSPSDPYIGEVKRWQTNQQSVRHRIWKQRTLLPLAQLDQQGNWSKKWTVCGFFKQEKSWLTIQEYPWIQNVRATQFFPIRTINFLRLNWP